MNPIASIVQRHRAGERVGVVSVCSAHPLVLRAAVRQARADGTVLLVEATSNQVDQFGGYTGMTPEGFRAFVAALARDEGLPADRLVLGGDHLGPNRWQRESQDLAMSNADDLVAAYAAAGYQKLHIDCSMRLVGDPDPLPDDVVARRAARLIAVAEAATPSGDEAPVYVIGTEVPVPGGAHETIDALRPTSTAAAERTLEAHRRALEAVGLGAVWSRVVGLVVQPGVEFDHAKVVDYDRSLTVDLQRVLDGERAMVFEAHSTDYQTPDRLAQLVEDHWAILKVGPWLTFALREALFALASIEDQIVPAHERSGLVELVDRVMVEQPAHWTGYYEGTPAELRVARRSSYSDRIRYYWAVPEVEAAVHLLLGNLRRRPIPEPLISQHLPRQYARIRAGALENDPESMAIDAVRLVIADYDAACRPDGRNG